MSHLKFGKIRNDALHICIDMQLFFLQPGPWYCDDGVNVLEPIKSLIEHNTSRTIFTRFITPENAKDVIASSPFSIIFDFALPMVFASETKDDLKSILAISDF